MPETAGGLAERAPGSARRSLKICEMPGTSTAQFIALNHHAIVQRANAQYFTMESAMHSGLATLGFRQRRGVFLIEC